MRRYNRAMRIGNLVIDPPVALAPMAGVTDKPFRQLCKRLGAGFPRLGLIFLSAADGIAFGAVGPNVSDDALGCVCAVDYANTLLNFPFRPRR